MKCGRVYGDIGTSVDEVLREEEAKHSVNRSCLCSFV